MGSPTSGGLKTDLGFREQVLSVGSSSSHGEATQTQLRTRIGRGSHVRLALEPRRQIRQSLLEYDLRPVTQHRSRERYISETMTNVADAVLTCDPGLDVLFSYGRRHFFGDLPDGEMLATA